MMCVKRPIFVGGVNIDVKPMIFVTTPLMMPQKPASAAKNGISTR